MDNSSMPPVMIYENKTPPTENLRFMACFYSPARGDAIAYNFTGETREIAEASIKTWWDRNNVPKPVGKSEIVKKVVDDIPLRDTVSERPEMHSMVALTKDIECEGKVLPAGSLGTIVDISKTSDYYEVEFTQPFQCVASLKKDDLKQADTTGVATDKRRRGRPSKDQ
jgi:hypothetical protein